MNSFAGSKLLFFPMDFITLSTAFLCISIDYQLGVFPQETMLSSSVSVLCCCVIRHWYRTCFVIRLLAVCSNESFLSVAQDFHFSPLNLLFFQIEMLSVFFCIQLSVLFLRTILILIPTWGLLSEGVLLGWVTTWCHCVILWGIVEVLVWNEWTICKE